MAFNARAQYSFSDAQPISGVWGSVTNSNANIVQSVTVGDPSIAGYAPNAPLWYVWTAPQSGEVELDTIGSADSRRNDPLDTVLGVYTGNSLSSLTQVAANDDLYPMPQDNDIRPQNYFEVSSSNVTNTFDANDFDVTSSNAPINIGTVTTEKGIVDHYEYYSGPSGLRFNAVGGQTYYFAVDSKAQQYDYPEAGLDPDLYPHATDTGQIILTWAYKSSGVFRFATENFDFTGNENASTNDVPPPLVQTSETESDRRITGTVNDDLYNTTLNTYYTYDVPGVPITITRTAGSSGRVMINYSTEDGNTNLIEDGDQPATAGVDYEPVSGTLIFDDFEMSKTIYVPIIDNGTSSTNNHAGNPHLNRDFTIVLTNAQLDPNEDGSQDAGGVSPPRIDSNFGQLEVRILDADIDPKGPSEISILATNAMTGLVMTNPMTGQPLTNTFWSLEPTNAVLNFMKANFRVPHDVTNYYKGTLITLYVDRMGTNAGSASVDWIVDDGFLDDKNPLDNNLFCLEPASDYAVPYPTNQTPIQDPAFPDFTFSQTSGTLSWPANSSSSWDPQPIQFYVFDNGNVTLDKDFIVDLYQVDPNTGELIQPGMICQAKVTILADRQPVSAETLANGRIPAGSVDENYNPDFDLDMAPSINTGVQDDPDPGTDGEVDGLVVLTNNETLAVGEFDSYDGNPASGICLIQTNGLLDASFNSGSGANIQDGYSVNCVAAYTTNQEFIIGGSFTSYNGEAAGGVARVKLNGSLDTSFTASVSGGLATVYAVAVQPNGQVLIGGDFTEVNGTACDNVARLNADGSVDTTFNPGGTLNGPVYALATQEPFAFTTNVVSTITTARENDATVNVNSSDAGNVTVSYEFPSANEMQVYYGGSLIYDTGTTTTPGGVPAQFTVPYGPGSTPIELVVNPGGSIASGTNFSYSAAITSSANEPEVVAGGNFSVSGQNYANIVMLNTNGALDTTFNPTTGADQPIHALNWEPDGEILAGGDFQHFNTVAINRFAQINPDGSLDTTNFYAGMGADDTVYCINYVNSFSFSTYTNNAGNTNVSVSLSPSIYIGGQFSTYNGTHRLGFARLYTDGTVDTTFMDSTYNQFAGLPKVYSYDAPGVYATGVQNDGNVMIGGSFYQVGGGEADYHVRDQVDDELSQEYGFSVSNSFDNPDLWLSEGGENVEPNARDGTRARNNIARLVGGATPGPGNLGLVPTTSAGYSANRNQVTEIVSLVRTNTGYVGPETANFSIVPGTAQNGSDLTYQSQEPLDYLDWEYTGGGGTRQHDDGLAGASGFENNAYNQYFSGGMIDLSQVSVTILPDANIAGNLTATYQLANPANADMLYLGGEDIAVGTALGISSAPLTLIDNSQQAGTFGFASATFVATNLGPAINVVRTGGTYGNVTVNYSTNLLNGGTAIPGTDYVAIASTALPFATGQTNYTFDLSILDHGVVYTNFTEKDINLELSGLAPRGNGAALGQSNATVRLINPNFPGYLTLSASNYVGQEAPPYGTISFTVNRVAGGEGSLSVQYATANGTAVSGQNYTGASGTLSWNNGDVSSRTITVPLINSGVVGSNLYFYVNLSDPALNTLSDPSLFYSGSPGSVTNATMTISDNNSYGSVQFSEPVYVVNEDGGDATITVVRSGGVAGPATVEYSTADGTALQSTNYVATSGTLTFEPNQLSATFEVPITNNGQPGAAPSGFYFNVNLSDPTNLALGTLTNAQVDILNDQSYNQPPGSTNTAFSASINGDVLSLAYQTNGQIMAAGSFSQVDGLPANNIVRLNSDGSVDTTFMSGMAGANGTIQTVASQADDRILIGGEFTTVDGVNLNYIARLMPDGSVDSSFDVGAGGNGPVYALTQTFLNGVPVVYAGGSFSTMNSVTSQGIARLTTNGTVDATFDVGSGADGTVYAIAPYPTNSVYAGDVLIGGSFVHYNGVTVNGLVRLNSDGSMDDSFDPGTAVTNGVINAIAIELSGQVLVGGSFSNFDGTVANNIVLLNDDGSTDTNFVAGIGPAAGDVVDGIVLQPDGNILVVGQFAQANGVTRNGVTRLLPTGATDPTINFGLGANGAVNAALIQPDTGLITLGGAFTTFNSQPANHIIQLYGLSMTGSGAFEFSSPSYQVAANGLDAPVTIYRVGGTSGANADGSGDIYVNFSTTGGTATNGVNYDAISTNVDFPAGEVSETVFVPILDDLSATTNLTVGLALANPTPPATLTNIPTAVLTILNVNSAVSFASAFTNVFENVPGGLVNVFVARQGATNASCTVDFYTTTNGSAVPGVDYYPTNETITFNPGEAAQFAQVLIISNSALENTIGLVLTNPVNTVLASPTNETLTVLNNAGPPGQLFFAATNYTANESAGSVTVTVLRTNGFSGSITYGYATVPVTAQPNVNYQPVSGTVTFNDTATSEPITVDLLSNNPPEAPVTFSVVLTNTTSSAATVIAPSNTLVTIMDDVNTGVAFLNPTNSFEETNGVVSIPVERLGNTNGVFSIQYYTTNGTALAGVNYVSNSATLNFFPGQTLGGASVTLLNNQDVTNEQFGMVLTAPSGGVQLSAPSNALIVLTPSAAGLSFTTPTNFILKNAGAIVVPVVCLNPSAEPAIINSNSVPLSVNFSTVNGTAQAGVDYTATNGTLIFTNGTATNFIAVSILNNSLITGERTFSINLFSPAPVPPGELVAPTNEQVTIIDDNSGLSFSSANYSILNGGVVTITVVRTDNTNVVSTVAYATTGGGTAVPGTDYYPTNGVLAFGLGQTSTNFTVTTIGASGVQPNKTVLMALSSPTPANSILIAPSAATLTILNENGSYVIPVGVALVPGSSNTPPGGILQPDQAATLSFAFRDAGGTNVNNLMATLLPINGVTDPSPSTAQSYGNLIVNGPSASRVFTLTPTGTNGQDILATFKLQDGAGDNLGTNTFTLTIGSWTNTFANTNAIIITAPPVNGDVATASPYPSLITVTNVGGVLIGATVTLTNFSATSPQAVGLLIVSPSLQDTLLMQGVGTANAAQNHLNLTFWDGATNYLPSVTLSNDVVIPITNGAYKPTQYGPIPTFP